MGIIASVAAFLGQKPRTASNRKVPEAYKAMSAAELKDRAPAFSGPGAEESFGLKRDIGGGTASAPVADAVSALTNLGYSRDQAASAVATALKEAGEGATSTALIRLGLKALSR